MADIDRQKLNSLMALWIDHENWIQAGCPVSLRHQIAFPGYRSIAEQDMHGYGAYRHSLVPYFAEAQGFEGAHDSLVRLVGDAAARDSTLFAELLLQYEDPNRRFRAQWGNLFGPGFHDGLSHQTLLAYQKKFEVVLQLFFLAQLRELVTRGDFERNLDRFRDKAGSLKKGVLAQYIIDGLVNYPELHAVVKLGYRPKLRNAVGHNTYVIENNVFRALDSDLSMTRLEFTECFNALQTLQNAVLWYLASRNVKLDGLGTRGVIALNWEPVGESEDGFPRLIVFQLATFTSLDAKCSWLTNVTVVVDGVDVVTNLSDTLPIRGENVAEVRDVMELITASGYLRCIVLPIMPCLHKHSGFQLLDGEYCERPGRQEVLVPARVVT